MKTLPKSQILRFTEKAIHLARRAVSRYSSKFSKHRYTPRSTLFYCVSKFGRTRPIVVCFDELIEMPRIRQALGLTELPTRHQRSVRRSIGLIWLYGVLY